jgi:urease gamma subunit
MSVIFESPWPLLIFAGIILLMVVIIRSIFPQKRHWWQWFLPAVFVVATFGLYFLVETDCEKINAVIETGVKAVEEENSNAIEAIIADNYSDSYHRTKAELMRHCRTALAEPLVEKGIKRIQSIEISLPDATAVFTVRLVFDKRSYIYQSFKEQMLVKAKLDLQKQVNGKWLITRAEILELDLHPVNWQDITQANW